MKRDCCKTYVLQQSSFCVRMRVLGSFDGVKSSIGIIWGTAKLTGRFLTVWLWKTFSFYLLRNFFLRIMGFQSSFLLLHPSFLQVVTQREEQ